MQHGSPSDDSELLPVKDDPVIMRGSEADWLVWFDADLMAPRTCRIDGQRLICGGALRGSCVTSLGSKSWQQVAHIKSTT